MWGGLPIVCENREGRRYQERTDWHEIVQRRHLMLPAIRAIFL